MKKNQKRCKKNNFVCFLLVGCISVVCLFVLLCNILIEDKDKSLVMNNKQQANMMDEKSAWYLILVNQNNAIPDTYSVELMNLSNGEKVDKRIYESLQKMFNDAKAQGVYPIVVSGYRSAQDQQSILKEKIQAYEIEGYGKEGAEKKALEWVARPGYSEHQLGISIDINADLSRSTDEEVYEWLAKNSYKYGFIQRYPSTKVNITKVINEPWHYRYVGKKAALEMFKSGKCLEEYLGE